MSEDLLRDSSRFSYFSLRRFHILIAGKSFVWTLLGLITLVNGVWDARVHVPFPGHYFCFAIVSILSLIAMVSEEKRPRFAAIVAVFAVWSAMSVTFMEFSYLAATSNFPLQDAVLRRFDHAFNFDWLGWRAIVNDYEFLYFLLLAAYSSMLPQMAFAVVYFGLQRKTDRVNELLLMVAVTVVVVIFISIFWPALGPFYEYGDRAGSYPFNDLLQLRAGPPWKALSVQGIVSFPSFHTVMAFLLTYMFRRTGWVGFGIALLNACMLLAIPPFGGHYLVDMFAGAALAVGVIVIVQICRPSEGLSRITRSL